MACTTAGPDGYLDLVFKFDKQDLAAAIGEVDDGDCIPMVIIGNLLEEYGATEFSGYDYVRIIDNSKEPPVTPNGNGKNKNK